VETVALPQKKRSFVVKALLVVVAIFVLWVVAVALSSLVVASRVPVSLTPTFSVNQFGGDVAAQGTWVIEGQQQAFPLQTSKVHCSAAAKVCRSATASVGYGDQLRVDMDVYDIVEWGQSRIVYVDEAPACTHYVYTIDLLTKTVHGIRHRREKPTFGDQSCEEFDKELRLSLKDGFGVWWSLRQTAEPWFGQVVSGPFRLLH
jgi:hypothetical protein